MREGEEAKKREWEKKGGKGIESERGSDLTLAGRKERVDMNTLLSYVNVYIYATYTYMYTYMYVIP